MSRQHGSNTPTPSQADLDNRSRQLNDRDSAYWDSRGQPQPTEPAADNVAVPPAKDD